MISNVRKMILICEILLTVTTDDHSLKRGFFIEMDSACSKVDLIAMRWKISARPFLLFF